MRRRTGTKSCGRRSHFPVQVSISHACRAQTRLSPSSHPSESQPPSWGQRSSRAKARPSPRTTTATAWSPSRAAMTSPGEAGADRVLLVAAEKPTPTLWATIGAALITACEQVQPSLVLLASTAGGRDIAPRLAAHLGGAYFAEPAVEAGPRGEVVLSRTV